nr:beta-galactosidase [Massilia terrae]
MFLAAHGSAEELTIRADTRPAAPRAGELKMGSHTAPGGATLTVNSRFIEINGKPVIPVMGEFHYSRYPAADWEAELLKMKAAGVNVVSTYIIWQHHQEKPGASGWSGNRDLRRFVQLAQKHGLYVFLRIGPWAHAEVRYGGIPDWVVDSMPTRRNDPLYLATVDGFFKEIAAQARGLLWKDGGPVIGVQIENEYNRTGAGQGREHIAVLKAMALKDGLDTPLYTVTGWDRTIFPRGEVIPVFGTYVDEPWSELLSALPPKSSYMFQFGVRDEKGLGAQGGNSKVGDAARDQDITPFFGAEYGAGVPAMYRRRPLVSPDDIADMAITKMGSGVNLLGYYMFHGGQNPAGYPSREETTTLGAPNDLPKLNYDFQAPLGEYGDARPVLNRLKPLHYFIQSFGDRLAPTEVFAPDVQAKNAADMATLRWSVRGDGKSGFLFVNNYVRQYDMAEHRDVRFTVKMAGETLTLPSHGITVNQGDAFIWPLRFDLSGVSLAWATAQPVTRIRDDQGELYVFMQTGQIPAEFVFDGGKIVRPSPGQVVTVDGGEHRTARFVLLTQAQAEHLTRVSLGRRDYLVASEAHVFEGVDGAIELRQTSPAFRFGIYPKPPKALGGSLALAPSGQDGIFQTYVASAQPVTLGADVKLLRPADKMPPSKTPSTIPRPEAFGASAAWSIALPAGVLDHVSDVFLDIDYQGDVARLFAGAEMLDDDYFNGKTWRIGLKRYAGKLGTPLMLTVLPLREDAKVYFDPTVAPQFENGQLAKLKHATLVPEYGLTVRPK